MDANLTREQRKYIYKRDGCRCVVCDSTDSLQKHHFIPRGIGGMSHPSNLITLCWRCHAFAHQVDVLNIDDDDTFMFYWRKQQDDIAEYLSGMYEDWPRHCYDPCEPFEE